MKKVITEKEINKFRRDLLKMEKSLSTVEKYMRDIRKLQKYVGQERLTKQLLLQYKDYLEQQEKYKVSSINSFITAINCFCNVMNWKELCIKTIKVQRTAFEIEEKELTMDEYKRMVCKALEYGNEKTALILQTIAATGIRVSELCYIDVDCLETGIVDVYNKGKVRRILLPSELQNLLKEYVEKQNIRNGVIFQNRRKQPIDRREVWWLMKKAAAAANIPKSKAFPHNLRHLFARQFYHQTKDIAKLADVLGHSSIETTRIYIKSTGKEHKRQLDRMNMLLDNNDQSIKNEENECSKIINTDGMHSESKNSDIGDLKRKDKYTEKISHDKYVQETYEMIKQDNIQSIYYNDGVCENDININIEETQSGIIIASGKLLKKWSVILHTTEIKLLQKFGLEQMYMRKQVNLRICM